MDHSSILIFYPKYGFADGGRKLNGGPVPLVGNRRSQVLFPLGFQPLGSIVQKTGHNY
jgi:hypothetical protein